jgi:hypothetical protein
MRALFWLLVVSVILNVWLGFTVVRLENYHYGVQVGMCGANEALAVGIETHMKRENCLNTTSTRTAWYWHLWYGLQG